MTGQEFASIKIGDLCELTENIGVNGVTWNKGDVIEIMCRIGDNLIVRNTTPSFSNKVMQYKLIPILWFFHSIELYKKKENNMEKKLDLYRCIKNVGQNLKVGDVVRRLISGVNSIEAVNVANSEHFYISFDMLDECFIPLEMRLKDIKPITGCLWRCTEHGNNFIRKGDVVEYIGFSDKGKMFENLRTGMRGYIENEDFMSDNYKIIHTNTDEIVETPKQITFESVCKEMMDVHKAKNHDYGNSFHNLFKELGINYAYGHLREKLERIKSLKDREAKVKSESMIDSLKDLANYAIMTLVELQNNEEAK